MGSDEPAEAFARAVAAAAVQATAVRPRDRARACAARGLAAGTGCLAIRAVGARDTRGQRGARPWAPRWAELFELRIGTVRLLGVPVETTGGLGRGARAAAGARAVVCW